MKRLLIIAGCFAAAVFIVLFQPSLTASMGMKPVEEEEAGLFHQKVERINGVDSTVFPVYHSGQLIGYLSDEGVLNRHLKQVYKERYEETFPGSKAYLGEDMYMTAERSYYTYTNADAEILQYLDDNNLYMLEATAVSFADDTDVYARIYVADADLYESAMNTYVSYFIDSGALLQITRNESIPALTSFGSRETGIMIAQKITTSREYARPDEIMKTEDEVLEYLKYGENTEREYYTVRQYDTIAGVGAKNHGLSATQILNINRDKLSSTDQILNEGEQLCVTYFTSPIDIVVTRESLKQLPVYYSTSYVEDADILVGEQQIRQEGQNGSRNVLYTERWVNGVLMNGTEKSSVTTSEPVSEVIALGTMAKPDVGTGKYIFPVDNPAISCGHYCYWNHNGTDLIDQYDSYGNVYASDTGVVEENSYNWVNGNYIIINHNNGYLTYYGHMRIPSPLQVGDIVTKGQLIGYIGMTGLASGPHVHFGVMNDKGDIFDACDGFLDCASIGGG